MSNNTPQHSTKFHKRHFKPFWPIAIIALFSFIVGGLVVWSLYKQGLEDDLYSLFPTANIAKKHVLPISSEKLEALLDVKTWKTYTNKEFGFKFLYPDNTKIEIVDLPDYVDNNVADAGTGYVCKFDQSSALWVRVSGKGPATCPFEVKISSGLAFGYKAYMNEGAIKGKTRVTNAYIALKGGKKFLAITHTYWLSTEDPKGVVQSEIVLNMLSGFSLVKAPAVKLLQVCPDQLIDDRTSLSGDYQLYYIYKEARAEIKEFDSAWVNKNCSVKRLVVY